MGAAGTGEHWDQRTLSFTQLPELLKQFLQIAAGAADIPITRFLGEAPGGMNSTGESDMRNYFNHIGSLQRTMLDPGLSYIDEVLVRSALGTYPDNLHYKWEGLWSLNELERAKIFHDKSIGARAIAGNGKDLPLISMLALSESLVNTFTEDGTLPGLEDAVATHGDLASFMTNENSLQQPPVSTALPPDGTTPVPAPPVVKQLAPPAGKKPVGDQAPTPLYVYRKLTNTRPFLAWARAQGFVDLVDSGELHVTLVSSKEPVDWMKMGSSWSNHELVVPAGGPRIVEQFGDCVVLTFSSSDLQYRHESMRDRGASHDFPSYQEHVTISCSPQTVDLSKVKPYTGELVFGPEMFEARDSDGDEE